jgi:hypothetical protein
MTINRQVKVCVCVRACVCGSACACACGMYFVCACWHMAVLQPDSRLPCSFHFLRTPSFKSKAAHDHPCDGTWVILSFPPQPLPPASLYTNPCILQASFHFTTYNIAHDSIVAFHFDMSPSTMHLTRYLGSSTAAVPLGLCMT